MESYGALAAYYDRLMEHVDYDAWAAFAVSMLGLDGDDGGSVAAFAGTGKAPARRGAARSAKPVVLDLACGTGSIAVRLAARGMNVIGIDLSSEMLSVSEAKAREWNVPLALSLQDITEFELPEKADAAVCLFDSLNYLTSPRKLRAAFRRTAAALRDGAPFLFDLQTEERLQQIGEETYGDAADDVAYIWQSAYDPKKRLCEMRVTLFVADARPGLFRRYDEVHYERAHSPGEVERALAAAGFALEAAVESDAYEPGRPGEGRRFYLARRVSSSGGASAQPAT